MQDTNVSYMVSSFKLGFNNLFKSYFFNSFMILSGHLALGYLVTYGLLKLFNFGFSAADTNFILLLGTVFGAIVDLDFFSYFIKNKTLRIKENVSHRDQMSHSPLLWLIVGLIVFFFGSDLFSKVIGLTIWLSTWGHFVFDTFEHGVMWRYPFSNKKYSLFGDNKFKSRKDESLVRHYLRFFTEFYPSTRTFWIELIVVVVFLLVWF